MNLFDSFPPTRQEAMARIHAVLPGEYARSRNCIAGAVTFLSPYITHGIVSLTEVLSGIAARHALDVQHKFVFELGWREYFRHVWSFRGAGILSSLHTGPLPEASYSRIFPADIRHAATGIPVIDMAVRTLYATGYLHNHARMWLASYVVHIRKVHWRVAADWMYAHLLDGDPASNHLSWQWVAGTGSSKPYLFNAENVARYAPPAWHSPGSVIDQPYAALDRMARRPCTGESVVFESDASNIEPPLSFAPALEFGCAKPDAATVSGRDVWLVHPWNLGEVPAALPKDAVTVGIFVTDFHRNWPWSEKRWRFVCNRMAEITNVCWEGDAASIGEALQSARTVSATDDPHLRDWLAHWAECRSAPTLFPMIDRRCDSFSQWWNKASRGMGSAAELLRANSVSYR